MQSPNHRPAELDMLSQHAQHKQAIPAHIWPIRSQGSRHTIPACSGLDKLLQHAVSQSKARKARHAIPACSGNQSQHRKARHAIPTYTAQAHYPSIHCTKLTCIKEAAKAQNSGHADTATCCITRRTRARGAAEQAATTPWDTRQEA